MACREKAWVGDSGFGLGRPGPPTYAALGQKRVSGTDVVRLTETNNSQAYISRETNRLKPGQKGYFSVLGHTCPSVY
ncbi:hypothetical protein AWW67_13150 [Roseivirga seohaensis]|uniref:Uncharacterized protein n=1 Tax=Roseivirga seohaensis TaxID=1914963 RepID=A0A150XKQ4_9BACT|nr:hypothetical protein AWW67_13150 [Roseivirga seohaensis]